MSNTTEMLTSHEVRWRNYQQLIRSQKLIHHQIQLQNAKQTGLNGETVQQNGNEPNNQPENKTPDEKTKDGDPWENFEAGAAFLGPTLWDKRVPYDGQDFKLEYVDIEEFLNENGIPLDPLLHGGGGSGGDNGLKNGQMGIPSLHHQQQQQQYQQHNGQNGNSPPGVSQYPPLANHYLAGPSRGHQNGHSNGHLLQNGHTHNHNHHNGHSGHSSSSGSSGVHAQMPGHMRNMSTILSHTSRSPSPSESSSSMTSRDTPALSPDSTQPLGGFAKFDVPSFSLAEGAIDFDPRTRTFTEDELKPQPMIKKSKKQFVPDEQKDAKYWARRRKNNMAAKRSRDARRIKENQIAMRAGWLEKQNHLMKDEVERVHKENMLLKEKLGRCHCDH